MLRALPVSLAVTIDLQAQFLAPASGDRPVDSVTEILRETGRMAFLRGLVIQEDTIAASFSATVRKAPAR